METLQEFYDRVRMRERYVDSLPIPVQTKAQVKKIVVQRMSKPVAPTPSIQFIEHEPVKKLIVTAYEYSDYRKTVDK